MNSNASRGSPPAAMTASHWTQLRLTQFFELDTHHTRTPFVYFCVSILLCTKLREERKNMKKRRRKKKEEKKTGRILTAEKIRDRKERKLGIPRKISVIIDQNKYKIVVMEEGVRSIMVLIITDSLNWNILP